MTDGIYLDAYIKLTLLSIARAVKDAQLDEEVGDLIGRVRSHNDVPTDEQKNFITEVAFDVATTVSEGGSASGGAGIKVPAVGSIGAKGTHETSQSNVSRVSFTVPLAIPRPQAQRDHDAALEEQRRIRNQRENARLRDLGSWMA